MPFSPQSVLSRLATALIAPQCPLMGAPEKQGSRYRRHACECQRLLCCKAAKISCCPHLDVLGSSRRPLRPHASAHRQAADSNQATCTLQANGRQACLLVLSAAAQRLGKKQWTT